MSYDEMQQTWNQQPAKTMNHEEALEWIRKNRRSYVATTATVTFSVMIGVGILTLKLAIIFYDPERTFANSSLDLFLGLIVFFVGIFGLRQYVRQRREFAALGDDPVSCLDAIIAATRKEIHETRRSGPIVYLTILPLVGISQWQFVTVGFATVRDAWGVIAMAAAMFIIAGAFLYHRTNAFLKPRLESLKATRQTFV